MGKKSKYNVSKADVNKTDARLKKPTNTSKHQLNCTVLKAIFKVRPTSVTQSNTLKRVKTKASVIGQWIKDSKSSNFVLNEPKNNDTKEEPKRIISVKSNSLRTEKPSLVSKIQSRSLFSGLKASDRLKGSYFRFLNEKLYTSTGDEALKYFEENPESYQQYHDGYKKQVSKWPVNPVDIIIEDIQKLSKNLVIADLGCGEAKIAQMFPKRKIHSFDLKPLNEHVTKCDISKVPLENSSIDVAIFCLSLMGTNIKEYLLEAKRILKLGGILKIAEIQSRLLNPDDFVKKLRNMGYKLITKDLSNKMFALFDFKLGKRRHKKMFQEVTLEPCLYKRR